MLVRAKARLIGRGPMYSGRVVTEHAESVRKMEMRAGYVGPRPEKADLRSTRYFLQNT